jgi:hypothetical protein
MNYCQRVLDSGELCDFLVAQEGCFDDRPMCGRPAKFRSKFADGDGEEVVLWLCAECFDEYERRFGEGTWAEDEWTGAWEEE